MKIKLAITMGDAAGIGPEITAKALLNRDIYEKSLPVVIGDYEAMADALRLMNGSQKINVIKNVRDAEGKYGVVDLIDLGYLKKGSWEYKKVSAETGEAAFQYIKTAIDLTVGKEFDAIVTGPINKESINLAGHHFSGHTDILAHYTGVKNYAMLLASKKLNVIHVTTHVSMEDACKLITKERVYNVILLAQEAMKQMGFADPKIGVAGLNAHSSENGLFGNQEADAIIPAIEQAQKQGVNAEGPVPPDTVFVKALAGTFDIVVAMYHDQGHIPLKLTGFEMDAATGKYSSMSGINCTIGLPFIRTSVDHGTAFGKAGENRANEESMLEAIEAAIIMAKNK